MTPLSPLVAIGLLVPMLANLAIAQTDGVTWQATPCKVAPRIDGVDKPEEWDSAERYEVDLPTIMTENRKRPVRRCELRLMNSATKLYVAFRVPDAARDLRMSPFIADVAILAFCRGKELTNGDDQRVVLPGLYADKHFVAPGKDAGDDTQRDGTAAMRWSRTNAGGEYFVEWRIPLDAGDRNDISVAPGGKLRFNLIFGDRLSKDLAETELCGLFGPDTDHAKGWGTLVLADDVGIEAPAPAPEWLSRLFPHGSDPDRLAHRLRRVDANEFDVDGQLAGVVTVELEYPGLDGNSELGKARIFLPPQLRDQPTHRVPLIHNAGYEIDQGGAAKLLSKGYAVCTPHAHPLNPLGRGVNLDRAILHAVRRLPLVDPLRVSIQGGSAGGWMTLMLAADSFPLVWARPDVPVIHVGYNFAYFVEHVEMAAAPAGSTTPRMPVVFAVAPIADQLRTQYGMPFDSDTFLAVSPLAHLDTITTPTLVTFSTADMLVPVDQVGAQLVKPLDRNPFPEGFSTRMSDRFPGIDGKRTLLTVLPAERYALLRAPHLENPTRFGLNGAPLGTGKPLVLPFSMEKTWSIVLIDEGPVEPTVGHFKYVWSTDDDGFRQWAEQRGVVADQLTMPKLERLMRRLNGEPWRPFQMRPDNKGNAITGNPLDYPQAERADVLAGLTAFATNDTCATRLAQYYQRLPVRWKTLGPRLGDGSPTGVRRALREYTSSSSSQ